MLLTFTIGLATVFFSSGLYEKYGEIPVDLPEVESDSPIVVMVPTGRRPFNMDGGGSAGYGRDLDFGSDGRFVNSIEKKAKDNPKKGTSKFRPLISKKP